MKIALIIYAVTIGALSVFISVAKYLKEHPKNKYRTTISTFSALTLLELLFFLLFLF